jgi:hypothetical protein
MKNKSLSILIKKVCFAATIALLLQGCAMLHLDGASFDDINGPNSGNPYATDGAKENDRASRNYPNHNDEQQNEENDRQSRLLSAIAHQDIALGMDQSQVMDAWGSPRDVETAGSNSSGAERWLYYSGNSLNYGMDRPRIVYFENGQVVGWESSRR